VFSALFKICTNNGFGPIFVCAVEKKFFYVSAVLFLQNYSGDDANGKMFYDECRKFCQK